MPLGLIIFARMSSARLPGKMLLPIAGRPLLGLVVDRARHVGGGHQIVVATSDQPDDDAIARFAGDESLSVFRGSLRDVASRALACCETYGFDRFVRICGDRPFLPWELIESLRDLAEEQDLDLATNVIEKSYPTGTTTEIVATRALRRVLLSTNNGQDREHTTRYLYAHREAFRIANLHSQRNDWAELNLSVDVSLDVERAEWILARLGPRPEEARLEHVAAIATEWERRRTSSRAPLV